MEISWLDKGLDSLAKKNPKRKTIVKNALPQKMSEVNFTEPIIDEIDASNKTLLRSTLQIVVIAWNYLVMSAVDKPKNPRFAKLLNVTVAATFSDSASSNIYQVLSEQKSRYTPTRIC